MKRCICILLLFITCITSCYAAKKTIPKHIVNDRNVLKQDMISRENTKYTIKYEFDLEGKGNRYSIRLYFEFQKEWLHTEWYYYF